MERVTEEFLDFLSGDKGFSKNTIAAYRNDLAQFVGFTERYPSQPVDKDLVVSFVLDLKEKKYAATTIARKIAAIRSYFHFLVAKGLAAEDPTQNLDSPKIGRALPHAVSVDQVERLLKATGDGQTPESLRDRAMLELLYATGMRVSELVSLNVEDVNVLAGYVRCAGRAGRERVIPVDYARMQTVERYLRQARPFVLRDASQEALFLNHRGERLTRQGFWLIIKGYAKRAGIDESITPHTLRHSFAAHQVSNGAELKALQEILGHASIASTQVYALLTPERLRREWENAHPLA